MRSIYILIQLSVAVAIAMLINVAGQAILDEPTHVHAVVPYSISGLSAQTWNTTSTEKTWYNINQSLLKGPSAYDFSRQVKLPILASGPEKSFYRDPFVHGENVDYFCNGLEGQADLKLMEWLTQIGADLRSLELTGISEEMGTVFVKTGAFTAWVSLNKPLQIPIPPEFWKTVQERAPEQIYKGKLQLQLVRIDEKAVWFKIPLMREPLRVERKPLDNSVLHNILKPL